jgi:hypothetical protein
MLKPLGYYHLVNPVWPQNDTTFLKGWNEKNLARCCKDLAEIGKNTMCINMNIKSMLLRPACEQYPEGRFSKRTRAALLNNVEVVGKS